MIEQYRVTLPLACFALMVGSSALAAPPAPSEECVANAERIEILEGVPDPPPVIEYLLAIFKILHTHECVHLNEIQVLGTHNSYHVQPSPALLDFVVSITPLAEAWEYSHPSLAEQLGNQGIRQFELDVFSDPDGGQFFIRLGPLFVEENPLGPLELLLPGLKVVHVPHLDFETTCTSLVACLQELKDWSDSQPQHLPVMVMVEPKEGPFGAGRVVAEMGLQAANESNPFSPAEFDTLDSEIRSVFPEDQIFTPDDQRGSFATLEESVLSEGWPALGELRGQIFFTLNNGGQDRLNYLNGHPSLEGRVMFTSSTPGQADAAFVKINNPLANPSEIPDIVAAGYLVRTRADADTVEARNGDTLRRDTALASGAHFISTDFPVPSSNPGFTPYFVEIPNGSPARCNPVTGPIRSPSDALETLPSGPTSAQGGDAAPEPRL